MANAVIDAINRVTSDARVRLAMLMGSQLESGQDAGAVNSIGATGAFQILLRVHPDITAAQAKDPNYAARYMLPAYQSGVSKVSDALWRSDPKNAAALAAFYAEAPEAMYPQRRIDQAWAAVRGAGGVDTTGQTTTAAAGDKPSIAGDVRKIVLIGAFVAGGLALAGAGVVRTTGTRLPRPALP